MAQAENEVEQSEYGGIGRLLFVASYLTTVMTLSGLLFVLTMFASGAEDEMSPLAIPLVIAGIGINVYLIILRLRNAGYSTWWIFGCVVPILNVYIGLICLAAPAGYSNHKTLDVPGKIIAGLFFAIVILSIFNGALAG